MLYSEEVIYFFHESRHEVWSPVSEYFFRDREATKYLEDCFSDACPSWSVVLQCSTLEMITKSEVWSSASFRRSWSERSER